jgi:hypothetical protein
LLGKPQELGGMRHGNFRVDKAEAMQLHHLITQRLAQQHGTRPLQFTARIGFDNGTSVLLNSIEDFQTFHEVRAVRSERLLLTWTFLLSFPGSPTPEKQEVEFGYVAEYYPGLHYNARSLKREGSGLLHYRIRHTARTWGSDIESLLSHYMDTLLKPESKIREVLRENSAAVGFCVGVALFAFLMGGLGFVNSRLLDQQNSIILPALGDAISLPAKLDHIIKFLSEERDPLRAVYSSLYMIVSALGSIATGVGIGVMADTYPPSDVILTKRAEEERDRRLRKYERSFHRLLLSTAAAFILGLAVNVVYDFALKGAIQQRINQVEVKAESATH